MYHKNRYRTRNIVKVVDEMEFLVRKKGFQSIYFDDDTTNIGRLRMMEFAEEIKRRALNVPWAMMARADIMEEDILENLRSAGLFAVKYGVESSSQELVDRICKSMDLRKTERMIRFTQSLGIKTHLTFSFGLPGETPETIQRTIDFAKALDPDSLQFSIATAFPGTSYFQTLEQKGHIVSRDFSDYDGNSKSMLRTDSLNPQDLEKAKRRADRAWQEHVWRKRYSHFRWNDYWRNLKDSMRTYGPRFAFLKSCLFLRGKIFFKCPHFNLKVPRVFSFRWDLSWGSLRGAFLRKIGQGKQHVLGAKQQCLKIKRHYLNILGVYHGSYAFKGPDCVQIDLTSNCNNNCVSCWCNSPLLGDRVYRGSKKYKTLPTQLVKTVIDDLADMGTSELYFSGGGEPFMHPDILPVVEHAKARGLHCCINTNFTLVNDRTVKRLIEHSVDALTVSVWAAKPKTYVLTHPNKDEATFYRIKDTLKMLHALKNRGRPFIKIYNVISNLNYLEIEQMVDFAAETGAEAVEFTVVDTIPGATDALALDPDQRRETLARCERILKGNHKVQVLMEHFMRRLSDPGADVAQYDSGLLAGSPCYVGWVFSRIMPDGDVNFCLKAHRIPVGNLYESSFGEIWNSKTQRDFRARALKFDTTDSFFHLIGNDKDCKVGCYKSCDDIGRNRHVQQKINSLSFPEKFLLRVFSGIVK